MRTRGFRYFVESDLIIIFLKGRITFFINRQVYKSAPWVLENRPHRKKAEDILLQQDLIL